MKEMQKVRKFALEQPETVDFEWNQVGCQIVPALFSQPIALVGNSLAEGVHTRGKAAGARAVTAANARAGSDFPIVLHFLLKY